MVSKLKLPKPISCGMFLTYRCPAMCRHCLYASSPYWKEDFVTLENLAVILKKLSLWLKPTSYITFNAGIHFSGGEPFLNFELLLESVKLAKNYKISPIILETNCFWAKNYEIALEKFNLLKQAGLDGVLISINPFVIEFVNFKNIKTAKNAAFEVFGFEKTIIYQHIFYELLLEDIEGKIKFENFIERYSTQPLAYMELLPMGRTVYKLDFLFRKRPLEEFLYENCLEEFQNPYHLHIDNYGNYIPSFCAGISLNNIFETDDILTVELKDKPIIKALCESLKELYYIAKQYNYTPIRDGYISKCHLCLDIRKHIVSITQEFKELSPREYYLRLI